MSKLDEPLAISATLTRYLAESLCPKPGKASSCRTYHAMWQYFRLIGLIDTIASDSDFLVSSIHELARDGEFRRVLISASADYGMLARVIQSFRQAAQTPEITVLDLCETPLAINRWYAEHHELRIRTARINILDFRPEQTFDLICTHSFLGQLTPEMRKETLARWHAFLRPGGKVITTARVRYGAGREPIGFLADEIQAFHDRALSLAEAMKDTLDLPPETLAEAAREYASNKVTLPFGSTDEIRGYFTAAGFSPVKLTTGGASLGTDRPSGPKTGWKTERVQIIALKP